MKFMLISSGVQRYKKTKGKRLKAKDFFSSQLSVLSCQ